MIGITVPPRHIWSDIFLFLSISKVAASSSELLLSSVLNFHNRHRNHVPFVVQWISGENLGRYAEVCHRLPSPWGTVHDALVKRNSKTKPTLPAWSIYTNSIFPDSAVEGSPRTVTVLISKLSTPGRELLFLPKIDSSHSYDTITICLFLKKTLMSSRGVRCSIRPTRRYG